MTESHTADVGQSFGEPSQPAVPTGPRPIGQVNGEGSGAWIPSLATVLEKQEEKQSAIQPPPGAVFTPPVGATTAQLAAGRAANGYGARSAQGSALPAFELAPSRSRSSGVVALLLILLLVAGGGAGGYWYFLRDKDDHGTAQAADAATEGRTLTLPVSVAGYQRRPVPASFSASLTNTMSSLGPELSKSTQTGAYKSAGRSVMLVMAIRPKDNARLYEHLVSQGVTGSVSEVSAGFVRGVTESQHLPPVSTQSVDPGVRGGAMECAAIPIRPQTIGTCIWGDRSYITFTLVIHPHSMDSVAQLSRTLRFAAEH